MYVHVLLVSFCWCALIVHKPLSLIVQRVTFICFAFALIPRCCHMYSHVCVCTATVVQELRRDHCPRWTPEVRSLRQCWSPQPHLCGDHGAAHPNVDPDLQGECSRTNAPRDREDPVLHHVSLLRPGGRLVWVSKTVGELGALIIVEDFNLNALWLS